MFKSNRPINPDKDFFGFKMKTRLRYFDENILNEEMDPAKNIYRIPDNPKVVIDIGAHIGGTSIRAASMGATVIAFEPEQFNFETLKYNVKVNGFKPCLNRKSNVIYYFNCGVGKPGITKLYVHPKASGTTSSYLQQKGLEEDKYQSVEFISIKEVFAGEILHLKDEDNWYTVNKINSCDLLKLDCEGSEADIIRDLDEDLISRIDQISVEFHDKKVMKELIDKLSKWYQPENTHRYEWVFRRKV